MKIFKIRMIIIFVLCFPVIVMAQIKGKNKSPASHITGTYIGISPISDTITLTIWDTFVSVDKRWLTSSRQFQSVVKNGQFTFKIDSVTGPVYFSLGSGIGAGVRPYPFLDLYVFEPGDNVKISISEDRSIEARDKIIRKVNNKMTCLNCGKFDFSGKGSMKYQYRQALYRAKDSLQINWYNTEPIAKRDPKSFIENYHRSYSQMVFVRDRELRILEKYKGKVSAEMYQLLYADAVAQCNFLFLADLGSYWEPTEGSDVERQVLKKFYIDTVLNKIRDYIPKHIQAMSAFYPPTLILKERLENKVFDQKSVYGRLKKNYAGILKDRLLTNYLIDNLNKSIGDSIVAAELFVIKQSGYRSFLSSAISNSKIGSHLDFKLQDIKGKEIKLSDFKGKIVLIDFWFYGCAGCLQFYRDKLSKVEEFYKDNSDVVFISVSIDSDRTKWLKALKTGVYTSETANNLTTGVLGAVHPLIKKLNIYSYPAIFIVDRNGDIAYNKATEIREKADEFIKQMLTKK